MNFQFRTAAPVATMVIAMLMTSCMGVRKADVALAISLPKTPLKYKDHLNEGNSSINAGRHVYVSGQLNRTDGKFFVTDRLVNRVKLNGYKSTTRIHLLDKDGNIVRSLKVHNWANGTWLAGPSDRTVESVFQLSPEEAAQVVAIDVTAHIKGGEPKDAFKRVVKDVKVLQEVASN